tara:strand:- start:29172 stop:29306 length:135 start_codon:yes stop_codon:yes gene_type:complete
MPPVKKSNGRTKSGVKVFDLNDDLAFVIGHVVGEIQSTMDSLFL